MKLTLIVAMTSERVIGRSGDLPWRLPADLARFKRLTMGHPLIMGRKTFASIGRPLPGRTSIVLSRDPSFAADGAVVVAGMTDALVAAAASPGSEESFVIGGGEIYAQAIPYAERLLVTLVKTTVLGDAWFPAIDDRKWRLENEEVRPADDRNPFELAFREYRRAQAPHS